MTDGSADGSTDETGAGSGKRAQFLAGERPDDVAIFLAESVVDDDRLERFGDRVDGGTLLVVDGERGRNAFQAATGVGAMAFAGSAMDVEGTVVETLTGGICPESSLDSDGDTARSSESGDADGDRGVDDGNESAADGDRGAADGDHAVRFVLAFVEAQNEAVGGRYAAGDVVHAYAQCRCGTAYSDRWTVES